MLDDDFFNGPIHGNEAKKFRELVRVFDEAFSYETGFSVSKVLDFNTAMGMLNVQLIELLKIAMQHGDFEEWARKSDEKMHEMRVSSQMRMVRLPKISKP